MKNIAIFVSGEGLATQRIVKLFNEGNRLKTTLVIADDSAQSLLQSFKGEDLMAIHIPDEEWHSKSPEVAQLLRDKEVSLIVLDNFYLSLSDEILEATDGEMIRVTSPELAPREVVNALEADLRKPIEEPKEEVVEVDENPTPESEWANALKIQFQPPKIPTIPPEVPEDSDNNGSQTPENGFSRFNNYQNYGQNPYREERRRENKYPSEPMPSTWLVWSVIVTIFCCFLPGIVAIIFSSQVGSKYYARDIEGAKKASRLAEIWIIVSFVLGVLAATLYVPFMIIGS